MTTDHIDATSSHLADLGGGAQLVAVVPGATGHGATALRPWLTHPVTIAFAASRVVVVAALLAGGSASQGRLSTSGLTAWDGRWYLTIIRSGYGRPPIPHQWSTWPFFPLLPGLARVLTTFGVPPRWGVVAIANVTFVIGLAGVWRLANDLGSSRIAGIAVAAVAAAPFACVFSMGYPSSPFLAASTWAFIFLAERQDAAAGAAGTIAVLARPNGIVVIAALAVAVYASNPAAGAERILSVCRRAGTVCGPGLAVLGIWCIELWRWAGDPLVFWRAKAAWNELTLLTFMHTWNRDGTLHALVAAAAFTVLLVAVRRVPVAWLILAALYLLPSFVVGMVGLGRYCGECFPIAIACGIVLESAPRWLLRGLLTMSVTAMAALALAIGTHGLVP